MSEGLDGIIAARTVLSEVDGRGGHLVIRGRSLDEIAGHWRFEEATRLLFEGFFPDLPADLQEPLGEARAAVFTEAGDIAGWVHGLPPFEAVRALMARIPDGDDLATALKLLAGPAVFTAMVLRLRDGKSPVAPDPALAHAADILRMTHGTTPSAAQATTLDTYLVTVSDHGLNASTFAARVIASTHAGLASAVLGGMSALKGPLHGGAPGPVLDMLREIGEPQNARAWLEAALARGERLMGFGHRIYRVRDPRADALKGAVRRLAESQAGATGRVALAEAVEAAALAILKERKPDRPLETNVEFYTALLLEVLGFPADAFTCVFAMGRTMGWLAHAREQVMDGRLIRPQSLYVGPPAIAA